MASVKNLYFYPLNQDHLSWEILLLQLLRAGAASSGLRIGVLPSLYGKCVGPLQWLSLVPVSTGKSVALRTEQNVQAKMLLFRYLPLVPLALNQTDACGGMCLFGWQ